MGSCMFHNEDYDVVPGKKFISPIYLHFPHLYTRTALEKMLAVAESGQVSWDAEHGYVDRWLGFLAHKAGVPVLNYRANGLGYSYENISYGGRFPHRVDEAAQAVSNGAIFSHGVKDRRTLERIARKYGIPVVVAVNSFATDTPAELELIRKIILYSSDPGDVVGDFFLGNFTTAIEARLLGREPIGFEVEGTLKAYAMRDGAFSSSCNAPLLLPVTTTS